MYQLAKMLASLLVVSTMYDLLDECFEKRDEVVGKKLVVERKSECGGKVAG